MRWDPVVEGGAHGSPCSRSQEALSIQGSDRTVHTVPRTFTCPVPTTLIGPSLHACGTSGL